VSTDWTNAGYTNQQTFTGATACTSAATAMTNWTTGNLLLRLTSLGSPPCTFSPPSKTLPGNLAIMADGPVQLNTGTNITAGTGSPFNVWFFTGLAAVSGYCDFTTKPNSTIGSGLNVLVYTPSTCSASFSSNSSIASGQIFSGTVNFKANTSFQYTTMSIPGTTAPGFKQDIVYTREVT